MNKLELKQVSVRFGKVLALAGVDIELRAGEVVVLVGPNGAGKSTLIRVLLGLVRPDAGTLLVDAAERRVDAEFKSHVGYLPEAVAFAENVRGLDVLKFFAAARGVSRKRVKHVLERVGLSAVAARRVRGYSRGMRQRLGLAVSILSEPKLLILDEPTGGLDQQGLALLWSVIAEWRQKGRMVLMASHELALVERRVDRVCLLRAGAVRVVDTPRRLRDVAGLPVRVSFILADSAPVFAADELAERLRGAAGVNEVERQDDGVQAEVSPRDLLGVLDLRADYGGAVRALRVEEPGLDAVYEHLLEEDA